MKSLTISIKNTLKSCLAVTTLLAVIVSHADDTEVFYSTNVSKPNLLFILDISGSMGTLVPNSGDPNATQTKVVSRFLKNKNDDAEQAVSGGSMLLDDAYLDIGRDDWVFNGLQRTGVRFYKLDIPQGAEITSAYIQFETAEAHSEPSSYIIYGEAADNSKRFRKNKPIHTRTLTADNVTWEPPAWNTVGERGVDQQTPDLKTIVQSIVDRTGWDKKNGMTFIIEGTGSRVAKAYDWDDDDAPSIHIEFTTTTQGGDKSRLEVMQESLRKVLESAPDNVNVGLMNYGQESLNVNNNEENRHHSVSGVAFPVSDINALADPIISVYNSVDNLPDPNVDITVREYLPDVADSWDDKSYTPITDALYEAALYYRGEKMHYGQTLPTLNGAHPSTYDGDALYPSTNGVINTDVRNTDRNRATAPDYISPIKSSCQANYMVLMSDGAPTYRDNNWHSIKGPFARIMKGNPAYGPLAAAVSTCKPAAGGMWQGECGEDITHYLANNDNSTEYDGVQDIQTYSIGFGSGLSSNAKDYLKSLATIVDDPATSKVENGYYEADNSEQLVTAFKEILEEVAQPAGTLASPGYSVNVKSGLEHEKDIYIPVFDRKNTSRWSGNLKKFRLDDQVNNNRKERVIVGKNGQNAVDELGGFTNEAWDYWSVSATADGKQIEQGGVIHKLEPNQRNLYSNLNCSTSPCVLKTATNTLSESNAEDSGKITNALLDPGNSYGITTADQRKELIRYIRGENVDGSSRYHMGDMLHSEPLVITYKKGDSNGVGKEQYIIAGTNEGFVHAFDTKTGDEKFAFMPKALLRNIDPQFRNEGTAQDHLYGVDGTITYWHKDTGQKGVVDGSDHVYLYFGLRRGGTDDKGSKSCLECRAFYALDITDINNPKFLWKKSAADVGLSTMGESWSPPYLAKVGIKTGDTITPKEVVIVSGGYDSIEDRDGQQPSTPVNTSMGHDIFIFDAKKGYRIWSLRDSMGNSEIKDSIPGGVRILDVNQNKMIDRMYFADTGGNVWRLDLSEEISKNDETDNVSSDSKSVLTKFATLTGNGARENSRKFYNEPDVSLLKPNGKTLFAISLGSGFRAHPMDKSINDKFFVLIDKSPLYPLDSTSWQPITMNNLSEVDISGSMGSITVTPDEDFGKPNKKGFYVTLPEHGEKVLGTAVTFDGIVTFTSLVPKVLTQGDGIDQCAAPVTQGRFYALNLLTGKPGLDLDNSSQDPKEPDITDNDAFVLVAKGEIPGKPQTIYNAFTMTQVNNQVICEHAVDIRIGKKLSQAGGYDACRLESVYWNDPKDY